MTIIDTHCHLDFDWFDEDREQVIERAAEAGVERMIVPGLDVRSCREILKIADAFPEVYAAIGVHPNSGTTWKPSTLKELTELVQHPKVVAIGEIGLDYYRDRTPQDIQREIFREQLELASETDLPVIIHSRDAFEDVLEILSEWKNQLEKANKFLAEKPGVLHSYSGTIGQARQALAMKFFLGFTGPVTFRNAEALREVAAEVPEDRLLVETDAPFLTPAPHRGKRNEPAYVRFIVDKIAEVRNTSSLELGARTTKNAENLFSW